MLRKLAALFDGAFAREAEDPVAREHALRVATALLLIEVAKADYADDFAEGFADRLERQLRAGHLSCEGRHRTRDGRIIPVDINTSTIQYEDQTAVLTVVRDITERKALEETRRQFAEAQMRSSRELEAKNRALSESEARYRRLSEASLDAIVVADQRGRIALFNPAAANQCIVTWHTGWVQTNGDARASIGVGTRQAAADVDAFQILVSTGTITSGEYTLIGYL